MRCRSAVLLLIACLAFCGCEGKPVQDAAGFYAGTLELPGLLQAEGGLTLDLSLNMNKTFEMKMNMGGQVMPFYEGTWSQSGASLNLKVEKMAGVSVSEMQGRMREAGSPLGPASLFGGGAARDMTFELRSAMMGRASVAAARSHSSSLAPVVQEHCPRARAEPGSEHRLIPLYLTKWPTA